MIEIKRTFPKVAKDKKFSFIHKNCCEFTANIEDVETVYSQKDGYAFYITCPLCGKKLYVGSEFQKYYDAYKNEDDELVWRAETNKE